MKGEYPAPEQTAEWMKNHTSVPLEGLPRWFVDKLTKKAGTGSGTHAAENMV